MKTINSHAQICRLLRELEFHFSVPDQEEAAVVPYWSADGRDRIDAYIAVHDGGAFIQFSTLFGRIDESAVARFEEIMRLINLVNADYRFIKVFRSSDGTLRATADLLMADALLTPMQFRQALKSFSGVSLHVAHLIRCIFACVQLEAEAILKEDSGVMSSEND